MFTKNALIYNKKGLWTKVLTWEILDAQICCFENIYKSCPQIRSSQLKFK